MCRGKSSCFCCCCYCCCCLLLVACCLLLVAWCLVLLLARCLLSLPRLLRFPQCGSTDGSILSGCTAPCSTTVATVIACFPLCCEVLRRFALDSFEELEGVFVPDASVPVVVPGSSPAQPKGGPSTACSMGGGSGVGAFAGAGGARSGTEASVCAGSDLCAWKSGWALGTQISAGGGSGIGSPAATYLPSKGVKREKDAEAEEEDEDDEEDEVWSMRAAPSYASCTPRLFAHWCPSAFVLYSPSVTRSTPTSCVLPRTVVLG
jgi:hypothetical protein